MPTILVKFYTCIKLWCSESQFLNAAFWLYLCFFKFFKTREVVIWWAVCVCMLVIWFFFLTMFVMLWPLKIFKSLFFRIIQNSTVIDCQTGFRMNKSSRHYNTQIPAHKTAKISCNSNPLIIMWIVCVLEVTEVTCRGRSSS